MAYLIYDGKVDKPHICQKPNPEHARDIWQCDECDTCFQVVKLQNSNSLYWTIISYDAACRIQTGSDKTNGLPAARQRRRQSVTM